MDKVSRFLVWDDSGVAFEEEAPDAAAAAALYCDGYDDPDHGRRRTVWAIVMVAELDEDGTPGDAERIRVTLDPPCPPCSTGAEHELRSPLRLVGGCRENPGVFGEGGGVRIHEVCVHCGTEVITRTWDQDPQTGEQGLTSVEYLPGKYAREVVDV